MMLDNPKPEYMWSVSLHTWKPDEEQIKLTLMSWIREGSAFVKSI